jgi:hypothetical protein
MRSSFRMYLMGTIGENIEVDSTRLHKNRYKILRLLNICLARGAQAHLHVPKKLLKQFHDSRKK